MNFIRPLLLLPVALLLAAPLFAAFESEEPNSHSDHAARRTAEAARNRAAHKTIKAVKPNSRKAKRREEAMSSLGAETPEDLEHQALEFIANGQPDMAARRYMLLDQWFPARQPGDELLCKAAGLAFLSGDCVLTLELLRDFGDRYPDSPLMTRMVRLAVEIGRGLASDNADQLYDVFFRAGRAVDALEFVNSHDPYSREAAEGLMAVAFLKMKTGEWEDALTRLQSVDKKLPGSPLAAKAEVMMAECCLGLNKGAQYSAELQEKAIRHLSTYLDQNPQGPDRARAQELLDDAWRRGGIRLLEVARYYCTARKWNAARSYTEAVLAEPKFSAVHGAAHELIAYLDKKAPKGSAASAGAPETPASPAPAAAGPAPSPTMSQP